jgi:DNA-binding NarL/FixJ family response regulator
MTSNEAVKYAMSGGGPSEPVSAEAGLPARPLSASNGSSGLGAPSALTPREWEIAAMIACGLTNRAIADELVISQATVARHVANILTKLGFGSRAQVAAWMAGREPGTPD